jgi:hypothetical protein
MADQIGAEVALFDHASQADRAISRGQPVRRHAPGHLSLPRCSLGLCLPLCVNAP